MTSRQTLLLKTGYRRNPEESYQIGIKAINTIYFFIHPKNTIHVATKLLKWIDSTVDLYLSMLFTTYIIWTLKLKIWIICWGIFNQCNCHICNTVYKHASFIFFKKAWPEKNNILVHWLCFKKIHYNIHSSENVS